MLINAAVLRKAGAPLVMESLRIRSPGPREVLVKMHAAGVCHTDYEAMTGAYAVATPTVLGHEGAGTVEAVGAEVTLVKKGDHVVCSVMPGCEGCFYCDRSLSMFCETRSAPVAEGLPILSDEHAAPVNTFLNVSSFADYCVVHERGAIPIPAEIPFDRACLLGCAVATGVGAVLHIARVKPGESVAVVGCGAVGLNAVQGARMAGAEIIVAIDTNDDKLQRAKLFGATHVFAAGDEFLLDKVRELTRGRGVDHGFEAAGILQSLQVTLNLTRPGATITILGKTAFDREVPLRFGSLMGERRIVRSSLGGTRPVHDFLRYARAYLDGRLDLDSQIDLRMPLARVNEAMDQVAKGQVVRTVLEIA